MRAVPNFNNGGDNYHEQRRSWRESVVASAVLTARGVDGAAGQRVVRVVNLSEGGVGLIAAAPLSVDTEYDLAIAGRPECSGMIRIIFCRPAAQGGFDIGAAYIPKEN